MTTQPTAAHRGAGGTGEPRISLCVIARDDAENLAALLEQMKPLVDEFVVVDTGSRDEATLQVAERFGARTARHEWQDDFAAARNAAVTLATGDWVLSLDPDERFTEVVPGALRTRVRAERKPEDAEFTCYCLLYRQAHQAAGGRNFVAFAPRLFPRSEEIFWRGRMHESPVIATEEQDRRNSRLRLIKTTNSEMSIVHQGHPDDAQRQVERRERNKRIVKLVVQDSPDSPLGYVMAGREHLSDGDNAAAAEAFERAVDLGGNEPPGYLHSAYVQLVTALAHVGRTDDAIRFGLRGLEHFPEADLDCAVALAYLQRDKSGDQDQALRHYQRARSVYHIAGSKFGDQDAITWKPLWGMGHIFQARGQWDRALSCYEEALRYAAENVFIRRQAAAMARKLGRPQAALDHVRKALAVPTLPVDDGVALNVLLADCLTEVGEVQEAYDHLVALIDKQPHVIRYRVRLADLLIEAKEYASAVDALGGALEDTVSAELSVYQRLGEALAHLGRYEDAANAYQIALNIDPTDSISQFGMQALQRLSGTPVAV